MDFDLSHINFADFNFEKAVFLSFGLLFIIFLLVEYYPGRNYFYSVGKLRKFIDRHLIPHLVVNAEGQKRSLPRMIAISLIWILLTLALSNPRWDFEQVEGAKPNTNLIILLDISKSMDAADEKPSRLLRAKQEITDIIKKAEGINIGIIAFANQSHIISPITDDKNALSYLLPSINTGLVGVQGSNITAGLKSADLLLRPMKDGNNYIVVMSDGGFEDASRVKEISAKMKNINLISFGFGTAEGAPIPDDAGKNIKDEDGKTVISKLEKDNLIALSGLDNYIQISYLDDDTQKLLKIVRQHSDAKSQKARVFKIWHDRFYIPLSFAMLILLFFFRKGAVFPVILLILCTFPAMAEEVESTSDEGFSAQPEKPADPKTEDSKAVEAKSWWENMDDLLFLNDDQEAVESFERRDYEQAQNLFSKPYNKGVAAFRAGKYAEAESYFSAIKDKDINAEYNLGNSQLLQQKLPEAISSYESVLKKDPADEDAKENLEIAKKLLNNQQNNKPKDQQNNKPSDKNEKDKDGKNAKSGSGSQNNEKEKTPEDNSGNNQNKPEKKQDQKSAADQKKDQQGKVNDDKTGQKRQDNENTAEQKESDGKNNEKELDIQAKSILSKISSDPSRLMKSRFEYEEEQQGSGADNTKNPRPW